MKRIAATLILAASATALAAPPTAAELAARARDVHTRAYATKDKKLFEEAHQIYREYLRRFGKEADAGTMAFYDGEALVNLERWNDAAAAYEESLALAPHGAHAEEAAYADVIATKNAIDYDGKQGKSTGADCPGIAPCPIPPPMKRMLAAYERYLAAAPAGKERPIIEYRRARVYYAYNQFNKAAPLFDALVVAHPELELAAFAANLEMDCLATSKRYDELRALIARLRRSPVSRDVTVTEQLDKLEAGLKHKP